MVVSLLGADMYCTEQQTCMKYLTSNLKLNPNISVNVRQLHWTQSCDNIQFDIAFGCDITYDLSNFQSIFTTVRNSLKQNGIFLLCHDNDSCPLSVKAEKNLFEMANIFNFEMVTIDYKFSVSAAFFNENVKLWKLIKIN
jgi:hypothetical protein